MARYHGRHRAPAPERGPGVRALARTALAGAVVGSPMVIAAPAAHAAAESTWDRVAQCESGGRWDINTGNGYHGGLQFSPRTWSGFGGGEFAPVAYQASRAEQIVVAERVLAKQGWGAWPTCSRKVGATGEPATARSAPAKPAPVDRVRLSAPRKAAAPGGNHHVVERGETLSEIAADHGVGGGWKAIVAKNPVLAADPDRIMPGQRLAL